MNSDGNPAIPEQRVIQPLDSVDHMPVIDGTMYTLHLLPFYTEGCALGRNLEDALDQALLLSLQNPYVIEKEAPNMSPVGHNYVDVEGVAPPLMSQEVEVAKFANVRTYLRQCIATDSFMLPDYPLELEHSPYSDAGVLARIVDVLSHIKADELSESLRLEMIKHAEAYQKAKRDKALEVARQKLGIKGFDPWPDQPQGQLFLREKEGAAADVSVLDYAIEQAEVARAAWRANKWDLPLDDLMLYMELAKQRFGTVETIARVTFAQLQEITHASAAVVCFQEDGRAPIENGYGRHGLVRASPDSARCPSLHHESRMAPFAVLRAMWQRGECQRLLGITGNGQAPFMPGVPPFFAGDITAGESYCRGAPADKGAFLGNQCADGGLHISWYNRRHGFALALSRDRYRTPKRNILVGWVKRALSGETWTLDRLGEVGPRLKVRVDSRDLVLLQGQKRNSGPSGGHVYVSWKLSSESLVMAKAARATILPDAPPDASFYLHLTIGALGPRTLPHLKSPVCMQAVDAIYHQHGDDAPGIMATVWSVFFEAHDAVRAAYSPAQLGWDKYEEAAALMGQKKVSHLLLETLGHKAMVGSKRLVAEDRLPPTVYCGPGSSDTLRAKGMDLSPLQNAAAFDVYKVEETCRESFSAAMCAETYRDLCEPLQDERGRIEQEHRMRLHRVGADRIWWRGA